MTERNKSGEARKGLIASVKGKVKEVVGAVSGDDSLTAEGQLEQTEAKKRKEANSVEAVADAEADQALADVPFAVLRFQYQMARFPLQVVEEQVVARMGSEATARLLYERSLGMLDVTVGNALDDPEVARRGAALIERSDVLRHAARLDATATQKIELEDAEKRIATGRKQADEVAAQREKAAEAVRAEEQSRISAAEQHAAEAAGATLRQADAKRTDAAKERIQADRIDALADSEKKKRQAEREAER